MKQHARGIMMLLAAFGSGAAVNASEALHRPGPDQSLADEESSPITATHNIGVWCLYITASGQPASEMMLGAARSICRLAVLETQNRHVAVDVAYVGPAKGRTRLGSYVLGHHIRPHGSVHRSQEFQPDVIEGRLHLSAADADSFWGRHYGTVRGHHERMKIELGLRALRAKISTSSPAAFRPPRNARAEIASMAFGSPGVVLLNGLGVILIGRQMRKRLK